MWTFWKPWFTEIWNPKPSFSNAVWCRSCAGHCPLAHLQDWSSAGQRDLLWAVSPRLSGLSVSTVRPETGAARRRETGLFPGIRLGAPNQLHRKVCRTPLYICALIFWSCIVFKGILPSNCRAEATLSAWVKKGCFKTLITRFECCCLFRFWNWMSASSHWIVFSYLVEPFIYVFYYLFICVFV